MSGGPLEYILIAFPGNKFNGGILPALHELVDNEIIHIVDLIFIKKDGEGNVSTLELSSLEDDEGAPFDDLDGDVDCLLSMDDIALAAQDLPNNCSAGLLVWENLWAARFANAVLDADGQVLANERIPLAVADAARAALAAGA